MRIHLKFFFGRLLPLNTSVFVCLMLNRVFEKNNKQNKIGAGENERENGANYAWMFSWYWSVLLGLFVWCIYTLCLTTFSNNNKNNRRKNSMRSDFHFEYMPFPWLLNMNIHFRVCRRKSFFNAVNYCFFEEIFDSHLV